MNQQVINSFLDELQAIDKQAQGPVWSNLGKAIGGAFRSARTGAKQLYGAATGRVGTNQVLPGLKRMAPAAAITGVGGLGLYGAGKATFGGPNG